MGVGPEPDRDTRGDDQLALEEIRRLFDRYRQIARHGMVTERDKSDEIDEAEEPPAQARGRDERPVEESDSSRRTALTSAHTNASQ